ncbi:MAG: Nramp family divalent metal transporter [Planctomycetota bacterium JB042]
MSRSSGLRAIGPGLLVAATGVGAGDLATGAFTGNKVGTTVLWVVVLGAAFKWVLSEGLVRYQLDTGETILEGALGRGGRLARGLFLGYLFVWSFFVGAALMSACGVAFHALVPVLSPERGKVVFGIAHSAAAYGLVRLGGYRAFERVMKGLIVAMFALVVWTAIALRPPLDEIAAGLVVPRIPDAGGQGLAWTIALMGGVGGTLTIVCYAYWIREERREGVEALGGCRLDLAVGYGVTALFAAAMVVIGSRVPPVEGGGATLIVRLGDLLREEVGGAARWAFLLGAWAAVFSSLLGVWQSVPYVFADAAAVGAGRRGARVDVGGRAYRSFLVAIATVPALGLVWTFVTMQKLYAIVGALFVPLLAVALLILNGRSGPVSATSRNRAAAIGLLWAVLLFFVAAGALELRRKFLG